MSRRGIFRPGVMAALATLFNFLALNLVLLIAALPVITLPVAVNAASVALDRWRADGEERVLREFWTALRSRPPLRTTLALGVPFAAVGLGLAELHYFSRGGFSRGGAVTDHAGFGLGLAALLITLTGLGYLFVIEARYPQLAPAELWSLCARLAVRNILVTGPLFLAELLGAGLLTLIDAPLLLLGLPVALLALMRLTALLGLRRQPLREE
jgi:hypothetical protein